MKKCAGCRKVSCDGCSLNPGEKINSIKNRSLLLPEGFMPDKQTGYGIAFDLGTTTVSGMLVDLESGEILEAGTCVNPQRIAGSDVVSRIVYCRESEENRKRLQMLIIKTLDDLARELCRGMREEEPDAKKREVKPEAEEERESLQVSRVTIVGNTAMCEILLGLDLKGLTKAPFQKDYEKSVWRKGGELFFQYLGKAGITILPAVEGYVGADALSVYTYIKNCDRRKNVLAVDIGTNGEIVLIGKEKVYACSTAAGPALEGASVCQGMGAAPGAIEEVGILGRFPRQDICCRVIGDRTPKGICGSGLVDALSVLLRLQVIDDTGYLLSSAEARKKGVPELLCRRISGQDDEKRILLTGEEFPVYLTQEDIRQLQLAKGAIRAGIEILLQKEGIGPQELEHIYLAGAFGSYIRTESAVKIGLLPDLPTEKITHAGNLSGTGAVMALLSGETVKNMESDAGNICHVEPAEEKTFQELYMSCLAF